MKRSNFFLAAGIIGIAVLCWGLGFDPTAAFASTGDHNTMLMIGEVAAVAAATQMPELTGDPGKDLKILATELKNLTDGLKRSAETTASEIKATGTMSAETKTAVDKAITAQTEVAARLTQVEQQLARDSATRGPAARENRTLGTIVSEDDKVKAFLKDKPRGTVRVDFPGFGPHTVGNMVSTTSVGGPLIVPDRQPGIVGIPDRRLTVRDLLTPGRTASNAIEFVQETGFTNNAAVVSETMQKPESDIAFELQTTNVRTIAHWVHASRQILDDVPMLQSYIDGRLRYGLAYVEEAELLRGSGVGQHLLGIIPQATAYSASFVVALATMIDTLRLAILQSELAEYPATGMVLNPIDWAKIELTKDSTGRYIWANPQQLAGPTMWGKPIVPTKAMFEDEFLVGAFRLGAQIFDREDANVQISTEDRDNFIKNMVTIRAEERLALAVYRPECFVTGDFGNVT